MNSTIIVVYLLGMLIAAFLCGMFRVDEGDSIWMIVFWPLVIPAAAVVMIFIGLYQLGRMIAK